MMLLRLVLLLTVFGHCSAQTIDPFEARVQQLELVASTLTRQLMLTQGYLEERTRSDGDSGIKQVRIRNDGSKPYYPASFASQRSVAAIHDHANHVRTVGMGEVNAVLNGVEFRTRHNDYKLVKPASTSGWHEVEEIPTDFPGVPPQVTEKATLDEQVAEMREWFKAWRDEDDSVRDYTQYFKYILCYMEGWWAAEVTSVEEGFTSDRHQFDAATWLEVQQQARWTAYTGDKSIKENYAQLPTTIINVTDDGLPVFAQWNYRILCHPIQKQLKRSDFKLVEDLGKRLAVNKAYDELGSTRLARFRLDDSPEDQYFRGGLLDKVMKEIPGPDNYGAVLDDTVSGVTKLDPETDGTLNAAYYHRWFKMPENDAMGEREVHRGYSDNNLFVAHTTQPNVAPISVELCKFPPPKSNRQCAPYERRNTYAIPLEVICLTPLHSWNPHNITYKGLASTDEGKTVTADGRNGKRTSVDLYYNGTNSKTYFITPEEFYTLVNKASDTADTGTGKVGVLDADGNGHIVWGAGIRTIMREIDGVGSLRQRWPIMPIYAEGSPIWKELEALRDVVLNTQRYVP